MKKKVILVLILVFGITICFMPLISQSKRKQDSKLEMKKPMSSFLKPDLQVDKLEFSGFKVKVFIKNTGLVNAPGPHIKAKITMKNSRWSEEKSIINRKGEYGAIIPTKKPSDRAHVTFDATGKINILLYKSAFTILLDSTKKVKELNEKNNTLEHAWPEFGDGTLYE